MRGSHDGEWLQHCDRHGYVEPTEGHSGRPSIVVSLRAQEAYVQRAGV